MLINLSLTADHILFIPLFGVLFNLKLLEQALLHNEKALLSRVSAGDERAFTSIVRHYQPIIYTYVLRLSGSDILADEIVQDSFLKTWLRRHELPEIENFGGWLYRVAANITYDALRKSNAAARKLKQIKDFLPPETYSFTSTDELILQQQYATLVDDALKVLPPQQLEAFRLVKLEGLTRQQAAARMNISQESVKSYLSLALQKIRSHCISRIGSLGLLIYLWGSR